MSIMDQVSKMLPESRNDARDRYLSNKNKSRRSFSSIMSVKTNVIQSNGHYRGSTSNPLNNIPDRSFSKWMEVMTELKSYEQLGLVQDIIRLIRDYLRPLIDSEESTIITVPDDQELTDKSNSFIRSTGLVGHFVDSLNEVIYYSTKGYYIKKVYDDNGNQKIKLFTLPEPNMVVMIRRVVTENKKITNKHGKRVVVPIDKFKVSYLVFDHEGNNIELAPEEMLLIGDSSFVLDNFDNVISQEYFETKSGLKLPTISLSGGRSMFYSQTAQLKNYAVKEALKSVLGNRDLLMPIFLKLGYELNRSTDEAEVSKTINELEAKINDAVDQSLIQGGTLDIDGIIQAALSIVRIVPDAGNGLSNLDALNLDPIRDKFEKVSEEAQSTADGIKDALGIPSDLFDGGSNQYEVLTRSQRYESTIDSILTGLLTSFKECVIKLSRVSGKFTNDELVSISKNATYNIFKPSSVELNRRSNQIAQQKEFADSVSELVRSYSEFITGNPLIVSDKALERLRDSLSYIDPKLAEMIVTEVPKEESDNQGGW